MSRKHSPEQYLPYPLYDSHFHALHMEEKGLDAEALLTDAFTHNLSGAMEVAVDEQSFSRRVELATKFPNMRLSAGIHPSSSGEGDWESRFETVVNQAEHPLVRAIGETGLDFYRDYAPKDTQESCFRAHLELSRERGLPVIIHNRNADEAILAILREVSPGGGIFHCFSSNWEIARQALDLGFYISFSGNVSYKNSDDIRMAAARVPSDRILIETDAPYLAPQSVRGNPNHPGYLGYTLQALSEARNDNPEQLARILTENARRIFE